jgi:phospholipid transport system transporter-binding protein
MAIEIVEAAPGRIDVSGELTFATARRARELGLRLFAGSGGDFEVNCAGVGSADSAGLAVLLDWLANARRSGWGVRYTGLPAEVRAVARITEVEALLDQGVARGV